MTKWRGMEVLFTDGKKMLVYSQFDLGNRYKVYVNKKWYYSAGTFGEAKAYYDKIR